MRGEQGRKPDRPRADDRYGASRLNFAIEHAAFESGRQDVAEHDQRFFVRPFGNGIEAGVSVGSADEFSLRAVDAVAEDPAAGRAVRVHLLPAILAFAAGADAGDKNMISRLERRDGRANLVDDAYALMAQNAAGLASRDVTLEDVQVGSANRRLYYFDDRVRGRRDFRLWMVFQRFLARSSVNESFHRCCCCVSGPRCRSW